MPSDLERFLQQAAKKLAEKSTPPRAAKPRNVRQAERAPIEAEVIDAEIIELEYADPARGPNPLSNIDTRPELAQVISMADERMEEHIHDVFDHEPGSKQSDLTSSSIEASSISETGNGHAKLVEMLSRPETLRAAFIASEIFTRKT